MKISIITPSYNSAETIQSCMNSIHMQQNVIIEHVVIDGKSNDDTVKVLKNSDYKNLSYISEPDNGIYDAMNKGILRSSGDIIGILNSDDIYAENDVLEKVERTFIETGSDIVYGNINITDVSGKIIRFWQPGEFVGGSFFKGWHPPHPAFFVKKEVYDKYGLFRTDMSMAADFEFMFRIMEKEKLQFAYIDKVIVNMGFGGATTGNLKNIINGNKQCIKAFKVNGFRPPLFYSAKRLLPKLKQFIKKS